MQVPKNRPICEKDQRRREGSQAPRGKAAARRGTGSAPAGRRPGPEREGSSSAWSRISAGGQAASPRKEGSGPAGAGSAPAGRQPGPGKGRQRPGGIKSNIPGAYACVFSACAMCVWKDRQIATKCLCMYFLSVYRARLGNRQIGIRVPMCVPFRCALCAFGRFAGI